MITMKLMVVGSKNGKRVELFDDGADNIQFRPEGQGSLFDSQASAAETLRNASTTGIWKIETIEVLDPEALEGNQ